MKKIILAFLLLTFSFSLKAQFALVANTVNLVDSTFSLYQQGSPTNTSSTTHTHSTDIAVFNSGSK